MAEIRVATAADSAAIAAVHVSSWRMAYRGLLPDAVLTRLSVPDRPRTWDERLIAQDPRTRTLLAAAGARVLGFASTGPARDGGDPATVGELYALYLDPVAWGRGIGTPLHTAAVAGLRTTASARPCSGCSRRTGGPCASTVARAGWAPAGRASGTVRRGSTCPSATWGGRWTRGGRRDHRWPVSRVISSPTA